MEEPPPVFARFLEDKDRGIPRAVGPFNVPLGKLLLSKGLQSAPVTQKRAIINPHWTILFPSQLRDGGTGAFFSGPS